MFHLFYTWSLRRKPWMVLAFSAIAFEAAALYFQYGKNLQPCVMCIYERAAVLGILIASLIAMIAPHWLLLRFLGIIGFIASSSSGLILAYNHTQIQLHPSPFSACSPYAHFPSWLPLDKWASWMFQPHGDCSIIVWKMLNWSMPQWLIAAFGVYLVLALIILTGQFKRNMSH